MIIFDGVSLESVAPIKIEDIRVSPIRLTPVTRQRAIQFGSDFVRMGGGERTIAVTFALLDMNKITRHEGLMNLSKWAKTDKEYKLELPIDPNRYLECVCTSKPEPSTRQWWESKLRVVFTCYSNPFWTSKAEKAVSVGTQFTVLGDAPPMMRIGRNWAATAYDVNYTLDGNTISLASVPSGYMIIDLNKQTITSANNSIMDKYNANSKFIIPRVGTQTITGASQSGYTNFGNVYYRERWE